MTTHTWGENPSGRWRLVVRFQPGKSTPAGHQHVGWLKKFTLMLHGTKEAPYFGIKVKFWDFLGKFFGIFSLFKIFQFLAPPRPRQLQAERRAKRPQAHGRLEAKKKNTGMQNGRPKNSKTIL